jgi:hypothetical protein
MTNQHRRNAAWIHSFVRLYRSFGQYVQEACPTFDMGEPTVRAVIDRQRADAERLGRLIAERTGSIYTGTYPTSFADVHYLNFSRILDDWISFERHLIADLEKDQAVLTELGDLEMALMEEVVGHERENLRQLELLRSQLPAHAG